ncbi:MAG: hypothetical protein ACRDDY_00580 [Clostridium sp.]|uniref:hypothetical protein n=1 Tax=Clostridium sp. TaxID=1506 RepID=UPI003EE55297
MKLKKIGILIIPIIVGFSIMGCDIVYEKVMDSVYGEADMDGNRLNEYEKFALENLKRKYGEEFVIVQRGGTHGANRQTKKFLAAPKANENIPFTLEVDYEKTETIDDYINIIMEEKLAKLVEKDVKEVFGDDVNIKATMSGYFKKYDSIDMDVLEFIKVNTHPFAIDIFIKTNEDIDKNGENKKIDKYLKIFENIGMNNDIDIAFIYIKENFYYDINKDFYNSRLDSTDDSYYTNKKNYNLKSLEYKNGKIEKNKEFKY